MEKPKPGVAGVTGDLREDCELIEPISAKLLEFFLEPPDVVELDFLSLRENRPIAKVGCGCCGVAWNAGLMLQLSRDL